MLVYKENINNSPFQKELSKRVSKYFLIKNISRKCNFAMLLKSATLFSVFLSLYFFSFFFKTSDTYYLINQIFVGAFLILSALNIGHDAMHGAFSSNNKVNYVLGLTFNLSGSNSYVWKMMHDIHHKYPNIHGYDNDISHQRIVRMSPYEKKYWFHKYQHFYVFLAALFTSLDYLIYKDFTNFYSKRIGNIEMPKHPLKEHIILFISKIIHLSLFIIIPINLDYSLWVVISGFFIMHFSAGFILYFIFTPAHLVDEVNFCNPQEENNISDTWAKQQLSTTCNYGNSLFMNFFFGGLNNQIEHHLFPGICHIHYPDLSKIIKATAQEYEIPYIQYKSFSETLLKNLQFLYRMGH